MQAVFDQAVDARDAVSGVTLDQEAAGLDPLPAGLPVLGPGVQTSVKLFDSILGIR